MEKVKIFYTKSSISDLEHTINNWLDSTNVSITRGFHHTAGTNYSTSITITIFYTS